MGVFVVNQLSLGKQAPGKLKPEESGAIDAPNLIASEQAGGIAAPSAIGSQAIGGIAAPNILTSKAPTLAPPFPLGHARILWDSILVGGSSTQAALLTPDTYQRWRPSGSGSATLTAPSTQSIDAIGIAGSYAGVTLTVQVSSSTGGSFTTVATLTPTDNKAILVLLDNPVTARRIRLQVSGACEVITVSAGMALQMQRPIFGGHTPDNMATATEYSNRISQSGQFLARDIVRQGLDLNYSFSNLTDTWVREYFEPFRIHAQRLPFFIAWRPDRYPEDCAYAWATDDIQPQNNSQRNLMDIQISAQGHGDR